MKKTLFIIGAMIAISAVQLFCTKQAGNKPTPQQMTVAELKSNTSIDLIAAWDMQFGSAVAARANRPNKPKPNDEITLITEPSLNWDGSSFITSDNPKFAAVNNPDLYVSYCNWFFWEGTPAQTLSCSIPTGSGKTLAWNSEWNGVVHTSHIVIR